MTYRESQEIRDRIKVVHQVLGGLLPGSYSRGTSKLVKGPQGSILLESDKNQRLAQFFDPALAQFVIDVPENLRAFMDHIERLEREAYEDRDRRRMAGAVVDSLLMAQGQGLGTPEGLRHVRDAIDAMNEAHNRDHY